MQSAAQAFKPAQQTRAESDLDHRVWYVQHLLEQAARGDHTAQSLSDAMASVDAHHRKIGPISAEQRDRLLSAVVRAQLGALEHLPRSYNRKQIDLGTKALAGQIMVWAETREELARRPSHVLTDMRAYARMFRNDMHNISLREEIDQRDWERRERHIQPLRNGG
jgi:hypothetical protein